MNERQDRIVATFLAAIGSGVGLGALLLLVAPSLPPNMQPFASNMGVAAMALGAGVFGLIGLALPDPKKARKTQVKALEKTAQELKDICKDLIDRLNMLRGFGCPEDLKDITNPEGAEIEFLSTESDPPSRHMSEEELLDWREREANRIIAESTRAIAALERRIVILSTRLKQDFPELAAIGGEGIGKIEGSLRDKRAQLRI